MTATVEWTDAQDVPNITNCPGKIIIGVRPPDNVVFFIPLPGGVHAAVEVDCHEFDVVLDAAHEKLVEAAADQAEPVPVPEEPPPPPPPPPAELGNVPGAVLEEGDTKDLAQEQDVLQIVPGGVETWRAPPGFPPPPAPEDAPAVKEPEKSKGRAKHK